MLDDTSGDLLNSSSVSVVAGTDYTFSCRAEGSKPPAVLTWVIGDTSSNPTQTDEENVVLGLWDTSSSYILSPDVADHNEELKCIASVPAETSSQTSFVILYVKGTYRILIS